MRKIIFSVLLAFSLVLISSCSKIMGYSVLLWNIPEKGLQDGDVVPVYIRSNISHVYVIGTSEGKFEVPLWQLTEPVSKSKVNKLKNRYADYSHKYATVALDGLPMRAEAVNTAKQVYRLRKNETVKLLYKVKGQAPMTGGKPLEGEWLKILTSDGTSGCCFSYNLRPFETDATGGRIGGEIQEEIENPNADITPQTYIFGAKAAPSYYLAKKIIQLINCVANKVNNDPEISKFMKVVFIPNYSVSVAEILLNAADVSEQISTAGKEASGTGNMKFMMNGAITLGTLDGANVEIGELVGDDNIIIFGMNAKEVTDLYANNNYNPMDYYYGDNRLRTVIDQLTNGFFENVPHWEFEEIRNNLLYKDTYLVLKDFASYVDAQAKANELYKNRALWTKMSIMNTAKSGFFTTDRTMEEYNNDIWHLKKIKTTWVK